MPAAKVTTVVEDQSTRVNSTSSYNTAIVIPALKGPINVPIQVANQTQFLRTFTPNEKIGLTFDNSHHEAFKYLESQGGLYVVRAAHTESTGTGDLFDVVSYGYVPITNNEQYSDGWSTVITDDAITIDDINNYNFNDNELFLIYGTNPGEYNNALSVKIITDPEQVKLEGAFNIVVYKKNGDTDVKVESFTCSLTPSLKTGYGVTAYVETVLEASNYVRAKVRPDLAPRSVYSTLATKTETATDETTQETTETVTYFNLYTDILAESDVNNLYVDRYLTTKFEGDTGSGIAWTITYNKKHENDEIVDAAAQQLYQQPAASSKVVRLEKGSNGGNGDVLVSTADMIKALNTLGNINDVDIQLIMDGGYEDVTYQKAINTVCKKREESTHGILSTRREDEIDGTDPVGRLKTFRKSDLNLNSYSCELYTPHQLYYDEFNDQYRYLSPGPYVASLIIESAKQRGWHWAVAGYNRGIVDSLDVIKAFEPTDIDTLSDNQINTIKKDPGSGNVIWDELTLWNQAADLQDAHIARWVNIFLRPRLKDLLKTFLFEFNDEETRALVVRKIATFMEPQKSARACYAYRVVCDETNNLDDDIENNKLNVWLYIKPTKIAKFITQKIILTPYSVQLEDLEM